MNIPDMHNILAGAFLVSVAHAMFGLIVLGLFLFFFEV